MNTDTTTDRNYTVDWKTASIIRRVEELTQRSSGRLLGNGHYELLIIPAPDRVVQVVFDEDHEVAVQVGILSRGSFWSAGEEARFDNYDDGAVSAYIAYLVTR